MIKKEFHIKRKLLHYRFSLVGLGFKTIVRRKYFWLYIGLSHFLKFKIPRGLRIKCGKRRVLFYSYNKYILYSFISILKFYKPPSKYKGKGLIEFKQFKGFIKEKKR